MLEVPLQYSSSWSQCIPNPIQHHIPWAPMSVMCWSQVLLSIVKYTLIIQTTSLTLATAGECIPKNVINTKLWLYSPLRASFSAYSCPRHCFEHLETQTTLPNLGTSTEAARLQGLTVHPLTRLYLSQPLRRKNQGAECLSWQTCVMSSTVCPGIMGNEEQASHF